MKMATQDIKFFPFGKGKIGRSKDSLFEFWSDLKNLGLSNPRSNL